MKDYKDKNDGTLVELTRLGDDRAYETLVTRHQRSVMGTAYKVTGNTFSAEDASQDAFVAAWVNLGSLRDGDIWDTTIIWISKRHRRGTLTDVRGVIRCRC